MNYKTVLFKDIDKITWDNYVSQIKGVNYYHSWHWLNCISKFSQVKKNESLVLFDEDNKLIGICPFAISFLEENNIYTISFGYFPCPMPVIAEMNSSSRRKILDDIFSIYKSNIKKYNIKKIIMAWHPLNSFILGTENSSLSHQYSFELLRYGMHYHVNNTLVIDLNLGEKDLISNLSKYHYRHIKRGVKKGIKVEVYNNKNNTEFLRDRFNRFQKAHFIAAGRMTRPQETWDAMYESLSDGKASLFLALVEDTPISYLYCGEFLSMAFGYSQVNIKEYEKKYSPRHILEWEAILYYKKKRKFKYYEIGERYFGPQFFHLPTDKEISISILKERYGGILLPKITWTGYCDKKFMMDDLDRHIKEFKGRDDNIFNIPE